MRNYPRFILPLLCACAFAFTAACGSSEETGDDDDDDNVDEIPTYSVDGTVLDFETGRPIGGSATITVDGLVPPPTVSVSGADFTISEVPPFSVFHILAGSPPDYRSTYNVATTVDDAAATGVELFVVREQYLADLASAFGATPALGTSAMIIRVVDEAGQPFAGLPGTVFDLPGTIQGPYFLDADRNPAPQLSETSASGLVVLFEVQPGLTSFGALPDSGFNLTMADSPVAATAVTLADVTVGEDGEPIQPTDVSFSEDIAPIFENRGCVFCHDGNGIGKDLGSLHLNGADEKMYKELAEEVSPTHGVLRVDRNNPELSLMLTMPTREDPPDVHPNVTFASTDDPDYQLILAWIREGALKN